LILAPWVSPSIAGKFAQNAQDVRFSDDATGMSHRNGVNFPKRAGNTNDFGSPFFWLLFFGEAQNYRVVILHSEAAQRVKAMDGFHEKK